LAIAQGSTGPDNRNGLAAFDAATGAQASFDQDPNSEVFALASSGSTVYVGGSFSALGSTQRRNIAAVRHVPGTPGTVLPFDGDADGPVRALAVAGSTVYLGGLFTTLNGSLASHLAPRRNLGAVDSATGDALPWDPDADGAVNTLAVGAGTVFAGGDFANVNHTTPRQRLAAFDDLDGTARPWAPAADATVRALAVNGASVFAGGDFANVSAAPRPGIAELDAQSGGLSDWNAPLTSDDRNGNGSTLTTARVSALAASQQAGLVAGGDFLLNSPLLRAVNFAAFPLPAPAVPISGDPGTPAGPGDIVNPGAAADRTKPVLSSFTATRTRFRAGARSTPLTGTATRAKRKKVPRGTTLVLRLSEPARVKFEVLLKGKGRKVGKKCVKPTRKNRKRKACTLLTRKGTFTRSARGGRSKVAFSGRLKRRALKPGRYLIRATPTDAAGNVGKARTLSITIVR
jgi:hypothetical protein